MAKSPSSGRKASVVSGPGATRPPPVHPNRQGAMGMLDNGGNRAGVGKLPAASLRDAKGVRNSV